MRDGEALEILVQEWRAAGSPGGGQPAERQALQRIKGLGFDRRELMRVALDEPARRRELRASLDLAKGHALESIPEEVPVLVGIAATDLGEGQPRHKRLVLGVTIAEIQHANTETRFDQRRGGVHPARPGPDHQDIDLFVGHLLRENRARSRTKGHRTSPPTAWRMPNVPWEAITRKAAAAPRSDGSNRSASSGEVSSNASMIRSFLRRTDSGRTRPHAPSSSGRSDGRPRTIPRRARSSGAGGSESRSWLARR